eukprot:gnl/MRDRNA2_/MRDRNA2_108056_c0_seq1.p1 gnl/MRDRNA2_/MRDRNA2_108056_c0~~gnl/MRDRNA2_/MRDRNA2_108056_c0_seq1.p1  ORF type:complete len:287 (+),score=59.42 gnl/MRDRNA2_/MRDRNA2_108056_c0_seq1:71-931(+)
MGINKVINLCVFIECAYGNDLSENFTIGRKDIVEALVVRLKNRVVNQRMKTRDPMDMQIDIITLAKPTIIQTTYACRSWNILCCRSGSATTKGIMTAITSQPGPLNTIRHQSPLQPTRGDHMRTHAAKGKGELVNARLKNGKSVEIPLEWQAIMAKEREEELKEQQLQEQKRKEREKANKLAREKIQAPSLILASRLKEVSISTKVKIDKQGHMFGSVTNKDIVKLLEERAGIKINKKNVVLPKPLKSLGVHEVPLKLDGDVPATFKLQIEDIESEAEGSKKKRKH